MSQSGPRVTGADHPVTVRKPLGPDHRVRAAIIGTGAVAHLHAEAILKDQNAQLVAVYNRNDQRREDFANKYGIAGRYSDYAELLANEELDVVHLCTPPDLHKEQTLAAVAAGVHVICEKPPALSLAELDDMQEACDNAGLAYGIIFQQRTGSAAGHLRRLLQDGAFGKPFVAQCNTQWFRDPAYYAVDWRGDWATEGGGTTLGHGIHQIDLLAHLLGDWHEVQAQTWRLDRETNMEDTMTATILFKNGVVAQALSTTLAPREVSHVRVDCEKATIEVQHLYGHAGPNWTVTPAPGVSEEEAAGWAIPEPDEPSSHIPLVRETYESLRSGAELPDISGFARRPFEIVTAIYASADNGAARISAANFNDKKYLYHGLKSKVRDPRVELI